MNVRGESGSINATAATATVALSVDHITKSFGPLVAVCGLSFEARRGEIIGLLGPNGAGKTTVIRMLSTILPPTQGGFTLGGVPHTRSAEIRRQIGVPHLGLATARSVLLAWALRARRGSRGVVARGALRSSFQHYPPH